MCGRFVSASSASDVAAYFGAEPGAAPLEPSYNVAPTNDVYAVLVNEGLRTLDSLRWGLIPPWARDHRIGNRMINARSETVAESKAYRRPFRARRCIVPADGFYEWVPVPGEAHKQPVFIHRVDGDVHPGAVAGPHPLAVVEHRSAVLLALADHHHPVQLDGVEPQSHLVHRRLVDRFLVGPSLPVSGGDRRLLGHLGQVEGVVLVEAGTGHRNLIIREG